MAEDTRLAGVHSHPGDLPDLWVARLDHAEGLSASPGVALVESQGACRVAQVGRNGASTRIPEHRREEGRMPRPQRWAQGARHVPGSSDFRRGQGPPFSASFVANPECFQVLQSAARQPGLVVEKRLEVSGAAWAVAVFTERGGTRRAKEPAKYARSGLSGDAPISCFCRPWIGQSSDRPARR